MAYARIVTILLLILAVTDALKCFDCQGGSRSSCARKPSKSGGRSCRRGRDVCVKEIFDNGYVWYFRGCSTLEQQQQHFLEKVENNKCGTYTGAKGLYKGKKVELCVCSSSYCNK